ncbi:histidine ammonia-lyase [Bradyrhizobium sp. USDA 4369]
MWFNRQVKMNLSPGSVDLFQLRKIYEGNVTISLDKASRLEMEKSLAAIQHVIDSKRVAYGVNTGFGRMAQTAISPDKLAELQLKLILSHSVGVGGLISPGVVRLAMAMKVISLARGCSGVRPALAEALIALFNAGLLPEIPAKGSVGASGDLAPLSHMACVLIGEGTVKSHDGEVMTGREALQRVGLDPFVLGPKEGLALINGTQVSTAFALAGLFGAENLFCSALVSAAMTLEAVNGAEDPFDPRIHEVRGQIGQVAVADATRAILNGRSNSGDPIPGQRVQDPYSIRCVPQVMGACLDNLVHSAGVLCIEANAASDNPLVFRNGDIVSGGNFHAEPVAFAADIIALAISEIGAISERRLALMLDSSLSGLPPFLIANGGLNSGFMIAQVTAAALASENKSLAHPASVDSLPTSANQEDHVSMATFAGRRLQEMVNNTAVIIGIEAFAACQGIELRRGALHSAGSQLKLSPFLQSEFRDIRSRVKFLPEDRYLADDIRSMQEWAHQGAKPGWPNAVISIFPSLSGNRTDHVEGLALNDEEWAGSAASLSDSPHLIPGGAANPA